MFESAASMTSAQLTAAAYYARIALEHFFTPEQLRKTPLLAGLASEPSAQEQERACQWLEEIQRKEGRPINQLDPGTIRRYTSRLSDLVLERTESEMEFDSERAQRLLEELRRAVPLPSELRLRRAG